MGRILAIDYGLKRCGLATTDPLQIIASPLDTIPTTEIISYLQKYIASEHVIQIVLGYPLNLDDAPTDATPHVLQFKTDLEKVLTHIPIVLHDERFTSKQAQKALIEGGFKKKKRQEKGSLDKLSALFILKSFLKMD